MKLPGQGMRMMFIGKKLNRGSVCFKLFQWVFTSLVGHVVSL